MKIVKMSVAQLALVFACGIFLGSWLQAQSDARRLGGSLSLQSHAVFLLPAATSLLFFWLLFKRKKETR